ncbi:A24 family peptidase [Novisyntrophococcus fermenticellae]|uniref:hypothetical protein n=1 Tax=Novisyntrophococcus fermenticellae TaxID=2068655 RepID=UPI001E5AC826|nr:hypothetical protein [Novisyntrophococcus fermenticellae]
MIWIESFMMAVLIYTIVSAVWSDCHSALISNKLILRSLFVFVPLNAIYYGVFARVYINLFFTNMLGITLISFLFYAYHIWAAGDSKLLFVIGLGIPARLYSFWHIGPVPGFAILIAVFSVAFVYVIIDSIICAIKDRSLFQIKLQKVNFKSIIVSYLFMVGLMRIVNLLLGLLMGDYLYDKNFFLTAIDFLIILTLMLLRDKLSGIALTAVTMVIWGILVMLYFAHVIAFSGMIFEVKPWLVVLIVMLMRTIAERYNYKVIPTEEIRERMIPSAVTVISFQSSRVQGMPTCMTEDLRARLSKEEVDSIMRWKNSKQGKPTIIIVRKIPFAIFIAIGTLTFMLMEGLVLWNVI